MAQVRTRLSKIKRSKYTGVNRCVPCTTVNVILALLITFVTVTALSAISAIWAVGTGAVIFCSSLLVIYFKGYLIPGTPELTKRYFPRWLLAVFRKDSPTTDGINFDPDVELRTAGLVIEGETDLQLEPAFARKWQAALDDIGTGGMTIEGEITQRIAALGGFDADKLEFVDGPNSFRAWYDDELVAKWESRAACIADIAAADIVPEYDDRWYDRPLAMQAELLGSLRLFVEQCPACHGDVTLTHEVVSSCCYDYDVVATTCNGCNARLFEIEIDGQLPAAEE